MKANGVVSHITRLGSKIIFILRVVLGASGCSGWRWLWGNSGILHFGKKGNEGYRLGLLLS
ncbi:hypothetical protein K505DRAFT_151484 [Melanomma pulvis-pyrius CBS 109.77]|uniref:Uncharacterized protein n=1 Tax=Melanomma pulvis-pyrius CBS 109.77 TaxID=1314802 RepID=A0A6A6WQK9_9PLEO|nr:hypothetical protein K505DRAFT_151484 [Melanomma pulvis-pyrius CBS 109.77]